jgi:hypothetical protein
VRDNYMFIDDRIEQIRPLLKPEGTPRNAIAAAIGIKTKSCMARIMQIAVAKGEAFLAVARVSQTMKTAETVYFPTADARDAFKRSYDEARAAKHKERQAKRSRDSYLRHRGSEVAKRRAAEAADQRAAQHAGQGQASQRSDSTAMKAAEREQAKRRARLEREAKAAANQREKAEAKKLKDRLKAETKAAGQLAKLKVTAVAAPRVVVPKGPAHIAGELDMSRAKITRAPTPPDRFTVTQAPSVVSSVQCRKWAEAVAA